MQTYIVLLRGINVSGQKLVKMDALRAMLTALGYSDVKTYIQSGNAVVKKNNTDADAVAAEIKAAIEATFGFDVPTQVRSQQEVEAIIEQHAFRSLSDDTSKVLLIALLSEKPDNERVVLLESIAFDPEKLHIADRFISLYYPEGSGKSKLTNTFIESKLKVSATTRNLNTLIALVGLC
jgi:uncharacterized protein (DUF1697 family)